MGYNGTYSYLITINIVTEHITHTWMFITFFGGEMMGESWLYNQQYWVSNHVQSTPWKPEFSRMATWNASMFQKKLYNP